MPRLRKTAIIQNEGVLPLRSPVQSVTPDGHLKRSRSAGPNRKFAMATVMAILALVANRKIHA
jgi:hypothetical protein